MSTGLAVFDTTVQETNEWLAGVQRAVPGAGHHEAYLMLRAVLHTLRDQLPLHGVIGLSAQLPMLLRGLALEGWRPLGEHAAATDAEAFDKAVLAHLPDEFQRDPHAVVRAVMGVMADRIDPGEMFKVMRMLPVGFSTYWPVGVG